MASMTPTGLISDVVVMLPSSDVELSAGLAIDIGCTNAKLVYRSNKEYRHGRPIKPQGDPTKGQVHYALFPRGNIDVILNYIKENADLTADESGEIAVNSAGVGGAGFKSEIESSLKCKLQVHAEFDCFIKAFLALDKSLSSDELFEAVDPDLEAELQEKVAPTRDVYEQYQSMTDIQVTPQSDTSGKRDVCGDIKETERPRVLVMGGSGTGVLQINRDGTSRLLGLQPMSGRFMQGLAGFLTGEKDYTKLEQMAASSDGKTTDQWYSDLKAKSSTKPDNIYDLAAELDKRAFLFGKGVTFNVEDVKRDDLVYSAFTAAAMSIAQMVCYCAQLIGAREVIFCGNLFSSQIMKKMILEERLWNEIYTQTKAARHHFVKNGGMLGALGAFIHTNK